MILGREKIGVTIQVKKHKAKGSYSLTVHGYEPQEAYNKILFLFQTLQQQTDEVHLTFYNTKNKQALENIPETLFNKRKTLPWMDKLRELDSLKMPHTELLQELIQYGTDEENKLNETVNNDE